VTPRVSVVIPARNAAGTLAACLRTVLAARAPAGGLEVVVVDNGSTDATAAVAAGFPVRLVAEPVRGLARARNRGLAESRGELVVFLDADCHASTGWLAELVAGAEGGADVVAGEVVALPPVTAAERYVARRKPRWQAWTLTGRARPWLLFGNALVRRGALEGVGGFDERFLGAGEDIDLSWRLHAAGARVVHAPRAVVFHRHRPTTRGLFRQQVTVGRAQALLADKYPEIGWSWRRELAAWADLARAGARAAAALAASDGEAAELRRVAVVHKAGQRFGYVTGAVACAARRAPVGRGRGGRPR
jgi:GT2 family glycosyltransferase